jgi:hypothetical protein
VAAEGHRAKLCGPRDVVVRDRELRVLGVPSEMSTCVSARFTVGFGASMPLPNNTMAKVRLAMPDRT